MSEDFLNLPERDAVPFAVAMIQRGASRIFFCTQNAGFFSPLLHVWRVGFFLSPVALQPVFVSENHENFDSAKKHEKSIFEKN